MNIIVMGLIIFLWFRGFGPDAIIKLGKNVELVCNDVIFSADYDSSTLEIINDGTVSIFNMNLKILKKGIRIYEVPISYTGREFEEGKKITWRDAVKAVFYLFKYRLVN